MSSDSGATIRPFADLVADASSSELAQFAIDGHVPCYAVRPRSVEDLQEIVRAARAEGLAMVPWGGGSQMGLGNPPERYDVAIDMGGIDEVLRYDPDDMTMSIQTGCRLADLNQMLGEHRQVLPVDAAHPERATIGGLVAAGASGPRRLGYGPLRDLIIGMSVVNVDGSVTKAGGQVVKNVTGYDMMRLHHGALGSLGIIVSVNLKVIPKPPAERTVLATYSTLSAADRAAREVAASQLGVTSVVVTNPAATAANESEGASGWRIGVRCEAPPSAVVRQAERVAGYLQDDAESVDFQESSEESESYWLRIAQALDMRADSGDVGVRIGSAPSRLSVTGTAVMETLERYGADARLTLDYGSGLAYVRIPVETPASGKLDSLIGTLMQSGDHATLLCAPVAIRQNIDAFGGERAGYSMFESLKSTFDPDRVFNPGRYVSRL